MASVIRVRGARTHNLRKRATVRAASGPLHGSGLKAAWLGFTTASLVVGVGPSGLPRGAGPARKRAVPVLVLRVHACLVRASALMLRWCAVVCVGGRVAGHLVEVVHQLGGWVAAASGDQLPQPSRACLLMCEARG